MRLISNTTNRTLSHCLRPNSSEAAVKQMKVRLANSNGIPWSFFVVILFFTGLWLLDFPKPTYDDLFQAGAALNLADGADFSNPLIVRQEFPSHYFFVYPPLNSYVFAGWLKLFGINALSVTAFPIFNCIVISFATIWVLRRHKAWVGLEWFVPLGVLYGVLYLGLRPEPLAIALAMSGFALADADATGKRGAFQVIGFLLIFLGCSAAPRVTLFTASLAAYAGYRAWRLAGNARERWNVVLWWVGALMVSGLIFLLMIHFQLAEFVRAFHFHAAGRISQVKLKVIWEYLHGYLGYLQLPLLLLPAALAVWAVTKPKDDLSRPALFVAAMVPLAFFTGGIGSATTWWAFLVMILLAGSLLTGLSKPGALGLQVSIFLIMTIVNRKTFAQCWGIASGNIKSDRGEQLAKVQSLQPTPEHPLLVDGWVARYVYDYRLPKGTIDAEWCVRFPGAGPGSYIIPGDTTPQLRMGDVFVVGYYMKRSLEIYTQLPASPPTTWNAFGMRQLSFESRPCHAYIITAEDCKAVRPEAAMALPGS